MLYRELGRGGVNYSAVSIFFEKVVLPLFVVGVAALALTNPMRFDAKQRISGAMTLLLAAYFLAHTISKPKEDVAAEPQFAVDVVNAVILHGSFWLSRKPSTMSGRCHQSKQSYTSSSQTFRIRPSVWTI